MAITKPGNNTEELSFSSHPGRSVSWNDLLCKQFVKMIEELANVHTPNFDYKSVHHNVTQNSNLAGEKKPITQIILII